MKTKVILTADVIIENEDGSIVLVKRKNKPYKKEWSLPGGKMDDDETIEQTAVREVREETGLEIYLKKIIGVYSQPDRDPRGRYVSVAFLAKITGGKLEAGSDAADIITTHDFSERKLAFDHNQILQDYTTSLTSQV